MTHDSNDCAERTSDVVVVNLELGEGENAFSADSLFYLFIAAVLAAFILKGSKNTLLVFVLCIPLFYSLIDLAFSRFLTGHRLVIDKKRGRIVDETRVYWRTTRKAKPFADYYGVVLLEDRVQVINGLRPRYQLYFCRYPVRDPPLLDRITILDSRARGERLAQLISETMKIENRSIVLDHEMNIDDYFE